MKSSSLLGVAFLLFVIGCGGGDRGEGKIPPPERTVQAAVSVNAVEIRKGEIYQPVMASGTVLPFREANIGAEISGRIVRIFVEEGDEVRRGQALFTLEQEDLLLARKAAQAEVLMGRAGLREARLQLESAGREKNRMEKLHGKEAISRQKYDDTVTAHDMAVNRVEMLTAQLTRAETNLAVMEERLRDSVVSAPFSGTIVKKFSREAELTAPGAPVVAMMNIDRVKVEIDVPELQADAIRRGTPVTVAVDALRQKTIAGTVSRINGAVNPQTHTFRVEIDIPNPGHAIKAGMFARVTVKTDVIRDVLVVPPQGLIADDKEGTIAFVVRDNRALRRKVVTGAANEHLIEVKDGLSEGERVIVAGNHGLEENSLVTPRIVPY